MTPAPKDFLPLNICLLTVSDTRTFDTDKSGNKLSELAQSAGHCLYARQLCKDDIYDIRAVTSGWIADPQAQVIVITGGTGFTDRDSTPEAMTPLFDKTIDGFGELFRYLSFGEIGTSTIQSRATAGMANQTLIFCLPGSTNACQTAWQHILQAQLDCRTEPCNFYEKLITPRSSDKC